MKLLLYCTKAKNKYDRLVSDEHYGKPFYLYGAITENFESLNGKIVAECDFEVEELEMIAVYDEYDYDFGYQTYKTPLHKILKSSCLTFDELCSYLKYKNGYAIHIKNLHIFDKPRELKIYSRYAKVYDDYVPIEVAPQNMMYAFEWDYDIYYDKCILISIQPQWLCKILNGEKTIEVRKKVLKEMLESE